MAGWRYQLALFAVAAARHQHREVDRVIDRYFAAWGEREPAARKGELTAVTTDGVVFHDAFACTRGRDDLAVHIGAAQLHMPEARLRRAGEARQCQGTAVVDWTAVAPDGAPRASGTSVFDLAPDGRIARVVGFWRAPPSPELPGRPTSLSPPPAPAMMHACQGNSPPSASRAPAIRRCSSACVAPTASSITSRWHPSW